jgi:CBS domain-containing protein
MAEAEKNARVRCRDIMTASVTTATSQMSLQQVAEMMREGDMGSIPVVDGGKLVGIVTDRDIVVRAVAEDHAPSDVTVGEICSVDLVTLRPDEPIDRAVQLMREHAVRRLPVTEDGVAVGVVSLGDLAIEREGHSVLADISSADPNL